MTYLSVVVEEQFSVILCQDTVSLVPFHLIWTIY